MAKVAVAEVETPNVEEKPRPLVQLVPLRRKLAEHARNTHVVTVEDASHPEDFVKPEFWALVAKDLQIGDRVDIQDDGLTFYGEYLVVACDRTWAKLHELRISRLVAVKEQSVSPDYEIVFKGPHMKYCVVRLSDRSLVHEGAASRQDANTWLLGYARTIGARVAA